MCTILAALGVWPEAPLVIAANRDESLDRPALEPRLWPAGEVADRVVLAPRDLQAGGTWLGLNDAGLFVGITNRRAPADRARRSRGDIVFEALGAGDHQEARARVLALDARAFNPFHLLLADRGGAVIVWADGERLHEQSLAPGIHWITERSFGAGPTRRHDLLAELVSELESGPLPDPEGWRTILADHRPHHLVGERPSAASVGFDSMCVHAQPFNYGTRSSTLIQLGRRDDPASLGTVRFLHAPGRPCETAFVDYAESVAALVGGPELE
jgi:hypothetical protein